MGCGVFALTLIGCSMLWHKPADTKGAAAFPPYAGLKARLVIGDFEVQAAKATVEIGSGVREMLIASLISSNRFLVVERQQPQAAVAQSEGSSATGVVSTGNKAGQKETARSADLIIAANVSEFEPQASGGRAGLGGGGGAGSGTLGGLLGSALNKAHMGLDISIVDASTSKTLANTHVQAQASDLVTSAKGGLSDNKGLVKNLSAYANTPMEKAIRNCIIETVRYISQTIPEDYYKY